MEGPIGGPIGWWPIGRPTGVTYIFTQVIQTDFSNEPWARRRRSRRRRPRERSEGGLSIQGRFFPKNLILVTVETSLQGLSGVILRYF